MITPHHDPMAVLTDDEKAYILAASPHFTEVHGGPNKGAGSARYLIAVVISNGLRHGCGKRLLIENAEQRRNFIVTAAKALSFWAQDNHTKAVPSPEPRR